MGIMGWLGTFFFFSLFSFCSTISSHVYNCSLLGTQLLANALLTPLHIVPEWYFFIKSHLQSYPCPLQINFFWNMGFLLAVAIILQIFTGILLALHYTSDISTAYFSVFFSFSSIIFQGEKLFVKSKSNIEKILCVSFYFTIYSLRICNPSSFLSPLTFLK